MFTKKILNVGYYYATLFKDVMEFCRGYVWYVSISRWFENNEFGKVGDNTPKGIIHEIGVEFYGTHQSNW